MVNCALENASLENEELLQLNRLISHTEQQNQREQATFMPKEEAENDDAWRHTYQEERMILQTVREGRAADAVRLAESMDRDTGRLSENNLGTGTTWPSWASRCAPARPS